jgi:predicted GNAT superfamily acetyltransferase
MPIIFQDAAEIEFDYCDQLPGNIVALRIKGESAYKVNVSALHLYGFYRNSVYDSYKEKADLTVDIKERKSEYQEAAASQLATSELYKSPLYHYSIAASLGAMKEWKESNGRMKCYIAYQNINAHRTKIGFIHFIEQIVNDKKVVYIAQAGVLNRGHGVGRHLMECVLAHYPAGDEFYIVTRVFNTEAKNLYQKRLGFSPIEVNEIQQLGYDDRYCGFKHTSTPQEINAINGRKVQSMVTSSSHSPSKLMK